ncbi:MAG: hypothetical protein IKQ27_14320 [Lachnospiraceae bacterium]|nr:hypothetical protein [Lachnospiraceae bacterium]
MDAEKLRSYLGYREAVKALSEEIEQLYNPVSSVSFQNYYKRTNKDTEGSTIRALRKVEARREKLTQLLNEYLSVSEEIEDWLENLHDPYAEAIIRHHFILGKTWSSTAVKLCGFDCGDTLRVYIHRLLKKEEQEKSD